MLVSELIIEVSVLALGRLIDESHLEQFVDDFEHELLGVEVVELLTHRLVNVFEAQSVSG